MDIAAGDKVLLEFSTFGDRYLSIVTDVKDDGRLCVYAPITDIVVERLKTDTNAMVKYAYDGRLMGFKSQVLNDVDAPGVIIELAKPARIFDAEERREVRCSCRFPATVLRGDMAAQAVVEDMSASCSRVRFINGGPDSALGEKGQEVNLTFHPFDMNGDGYSVGCMVTTSFMRNGKHYAVLQFNHEEAEARERISSFIEAQVCCGIPRL